MDYYKQSVRLHEETKGKWETGSKVPLNTAEDLSIAYTPGVAEPCREIHRDSSRAMELTMKSNTIAVISDGSAVLGLGNIGPHAAIPVMEGKAAIFKRFANVDAVPICLNTQDVDRIIETVVNISPVFGGINLEDISSPRCMEIERKLNEILNIPVFHDDQHGTAVVVAAALINAFKLLGKDFTSSRIVINGAGAAGLAIAKHLIDMGNRNLILCDSKGIITKKREKNWVQEEIVSLLHDPPFSEGSLQDALHGADAFIGVSAAGVLLPEWIKAMNPDPVIFAMANPEPEIYPEQAIRAGAKVVGTGRSDFANQINNLLAFPGIFRGALDVRATEITKEMKIAASRAIADLIGEEELRADYIIPNPLDVRVAPAVAEATKSAYLASSTL